MGISSFPRQSKDTVYIDTTGQSINCLVSPLNSFIYIALDIRFRKSGGGFEFKYLAPSRVKRRPPDEISIKPRRVRYSETSTKSRL